MGYIGFLMDSIIEVGQVLLKIDSIGFDAMIIGSIVVGLLKLRTRVLSHVS